MLFKVDSHFGHVIEETDKGVVYRDDGSPVDFQNPRGCAGCKLKCNEAEHDPCIANLPGTRNACCGHGLDVSPVSGNPNGYVALDDGRSFRFSGLVGGDAIRKAVDAALAGHDLPEGFVFDQGTAWWAGLSERQRQYVQDNIHGGLMRLVTEVRKGEVPAPEVMSGEKRWWDGLDEEQKSWVWARLGGMLNDLVTEAKAKTA